MPNHSALAQAVAALSASTGSEYTLAYSRNFTKAWVRKNDRTISPALPIARLAQWLVAHVQAEGEKNEHS